MFLLKVCKSLNKYKINHAIVGGHAVNLHGAVRGTIDIDFVIDWTKSNLVKFEQAMLEIGLISALPINAENIFNFKDQYIKNKNLIAWNFYNPANPTEQVDVIITYNLKKKKTTIKKVQGVDIIILEKKELIEMKRISGREQDLIDIDALEKL